MQKQVPKFYKSYFPDQSNRKNAQCNRIRSEKKISYETFQQFTKMEVVDIILSDMKNLKLVSQHKGKYYLLNSYKRFTWKNINHINSNDETKFMTDHFVIYKSICDFFQGKDFVLYVKYIFWYLRKIIIDSIISDILSNSNTATIAISVGSTKIDSDYDVTLYGNYLNIYKVIHKFNKKFQSIFNDTSDIIFDTNVYGASFIKIDSMSLNAKKCGDKFFEYIPVSSDNEKVSQHIWAFVKLLIRLEDILKHNDILYDLLKSTISVSSAYNNIVRTAEEFVNKYDPSPDYYDKIVLLLQDKENSQDNLLYNNYISFVNYNGSETYFTRGAFLDVVVNQQMCSKDMDDKILLTNHDYFDSFVENIADLMVHYHKEKYTTRAQLALKRLFDKEKNPAKVKAYKTAQNLLEQIKNLQVDCKTTKNILKCSNFLIMHTCMTLIDTVTKMFISTIPADIIDFGITSFQTFAYNSNLPSARSLENTNLSSFTLNSKSRIL
jgi:hypothetical protein